MADRGGEERTGSGLQGPGAGVFLRLEGERSDIAGILHNRIGQSLTACLLAIEGGDPVSDEEIRADLIAELVDALKTARELSLRLLPPRFNRGGFVDALHSWLERRRSAGGFEYTLSGSQPEGIVEQHAATLGFRLIQDGVESLLGVQRALDVRVSVSCCGSDVEVNVEARTEAVFESDAWGRDWARVLDDHAALLRGNGARCAWAANDAGLQLTVRLPYGG